MSKKHKYPQSEALEQARRNAIRMLGLHKHNTPEERARAMGFNWDEPLYHGTEGDFPEFAKSSRMSTYAAEDPEIANIYAMNERRKGNAGPNVIPLVARGKQMTVSDYSEDDEDEMGSGWFSDNIAKKLGIPRQRGTIKLLPQHGYDRLKITGMEDLGGQQTQHVFPEPHVLRSRFAAFDPARIHESGLNYAQGGNVSPKDQALQQLMQTRAKADKPYRDPKTTKIEDWAWRPLERVKAELAMREVPEYIQKGFGGFMNEQTGRAQRGAMTPRDLIKAYTIAQSSIGRGGLSHGTATKTGMRLPNTGGEVRPEGSYSEWLGSPAGQRYLDTAERGEIDPDAINDLRGKFAPFGKQNDQAEKMAYAALTIPGMAEHLNEALTGSTDEYRDFAEKLKGIAGAKSGFIGSLLGRGDLPTLDARQLNLHTLPSPVGVGSIMNRGKGRGAREAVDRLASRQTAMGFDIDPGLAPHYQHLAHHAVWDKASGTETTHDDLMRAMRGYAQGGNVSPKDQALQQLMQTRAKAMLAADLRRQYDTEMAGKYVHQIVPFADWMAARQPQGLAKGGPPKYEPTFPLELPKAPVPSNQEMQVIVDRVARQQAGEHVRGAKTDNLAGRSMRESQRVQQVPYELEPTKELRPTPVYNAQKGDINVVVPGDQTVSDMMLKHVAGIPINSQQEGGSRYGEGKLHIPEDKRPFWASGVGPAQAFQNKVTRLAQLTGEDPRIIAHHLAMGNDANNFAMHLVDANLRAIHGKGVSPENMEAFNRVMQAGSKSTGPFPHFPGVHNPHEAYEAMLRDPEMRKYFNDRMKTPNITQALGMPNGLDIDWAISHPELRNMEVNMTGHSVGRMKPGAKLIPGSEHNTYSHDILGESLGRAPELAPLELAFLDASEYIKPRLSAPQYFTKTMQGSAPHQVVDERYLNMMNDYYHKLRQTRGFAEGGVADSEETKAPGRDEMLAYVTMHKTPINLKDIGANEAPNMRIKAYVSPGMGAGLPVGGVDFQPQAPGQQMLPGMPQGPQGQPGMPPQGAAPTGPAGPAGAPPQGPQSNILQLTPQGQAMSAMRAAPPGAPKMAKGGSISGIQLTERAL